MALPQVEALDNLIEQQTTLADPAERDRALADIENSLYRMLAAVGTYRGDAQIQMGGGGSNEQQPAEQSEQQPEQPDAPAGPSVSS
jgi:hypothetical protein